MRLQVNGEKKSRKVAKGYDDLRVWQASDRLAHEVFKISKSFPPEYRFDLTSQLRRAVLSVPTNIAEGCGALHQAEYVQFLNIALRSIYEVEYLIRFAREENLLEGVQFEKWQATIVSTRRMMLALIKSLEVHT